MLHEDDEFDFDDDTRIIKHKHKSNFTMICNACINDKNLPASCMAILIYVMSKPEDWKIIMKDISKRFAIGRDKTYNIINKLIELGYMKRITYSNEDGSFAKTSLFASDDPSFLMDDLCNKQPLPGFQEVVTAEKTDKQPLPGLQSPKVQEFVEIKKVEEQPLPENPDPVNQEVDSLYTNKELYKENNNNKITTNPKGACATPPSDKVDNIYPEDSVVVFFMKKIEGSGLSESTLVGWLRKHGTDYVAEKIRIYQTKGAMVNPGGFLSSAIRYDWKDKVAHVTQQEQKAPDLTEFPTLEENRAWFNHLSDTEKSGLEQLSLVKHPIFSEMLNNANPKLTILDSRFPESFLFKLMMELIGRAKR